MIDRAYGLCLCVFLLTTDLMSVSRLLMTSRIIYSFSGMFPYGRSSYFTVPSYLIFFTRADDSSSKITYVFILSLIIDPHCNRFHGPTSLGLPEFQCSDTPCPYGAKTASGISQPVDAAIV